MCRSVPMVGAFIHAYLTTRAFVQAATSPTSLGANYEGSFSRFATVADFAVCFDIALFAVGVTLGCVSLWRVGCGKT